MEAIAKAVELVRSGEVVVMFPEGTRQRKGLRKRWEARPHTGAARIAQRAGAPLVPAAIKGTDRLSRLGPFRVAYGRPLDLTDLEPRDAKTAANDEVIFVTTTPCACHLAMVSAPPGSQNTPPAPTTTVACVCAHCRSRAAKSASGIPLWRMYAHRAWRD